MLIVFAIISLINPVYAFADPLEVNIISPAQVVPGAILKIRVSLANMQEISLLHVQSGNVEGEINKLIDIMAQEKNKIIINGISYENHSMLIEKKNVNMKLIPIANAIKLRNELHKDFENRIKSEKPSVEQIKSYIVLENELKKIIENGRNSFIIEIPVPEEFPEGGTLTTPINIEYSTETSSTQAFSAITTVTVTSTPVPKRAIIIDIDGARSDAFYNSLPGMPNMQLIANNGIRFMDATTVFPSITLPAQASIFTGNYPGHHNIPGNAWFEKSNLTYREYGVDVWYGSEGRPNIEMSTDVKTIYEAAKNDLNVNSTVIFNHYSRLNGSTARWIRPGVQEYYYNEITHEYDKLDSNAMSRALEELVYLPPPGIMTIYLPGLDGFSHTNGPNGGLNQEPYFKNNVDREIGRLLYGDCVNYDLIGNCEQYFNGLIGEGLMNETIIVIVSDHGQIDSGYEDTYAISKLELENMLKNSGYDIIDHPLESDYDAITAPNGGMTQIYIRDIDSKDWNDQPELSDLRSALDVFISQINIDKILVKFSGSNGYRVYNGSGNTLELQTFFAGKIGYPDAVNRIQGLDSTRSGDIILLAKNGSYFAEGKYKGEHGGLSPEESYIPLIFSGPTIRKGVTETIPARTIDMAKTLADLMGFSMPFADGVVLPVQEVQDTTPPVITFVPPTDPNNTILTTRNWTFINVSLSESGYAWLEWNGVNESMSGADTDWHINKTSLRNRIYTYRVRANDSAGNVNVSETRVIEILIPSLKGDMNGNGVSADAGDLVLMKRASIGEIPADSRYDLNKNGQNADAGDLVLMKRASIGEIMLS
jgi:arylsulfatase A-like enzyme